MILSICQQCTKQFYVKPNRIAKGWGKYCSNTCKHLGLITGMKIPCTFCNKLTYKNKKDQNRSASGNFFCNKSCQASWRNSHRVGESHANWISGESSYRDILRRSGATQACNKCDSNDIRVLAVHHKDKNRQNNNLVNLIWLCHNCHFLVHHYEKEAKGYLTSVVQT